MNANLEHKNWQQKLGRWLSGDATRRDEADLEKIAQSDSFLAESMEGYRAFPEGQHARKVTQLKAKLRPHKKQKKGAAWLKIAAIGAFLVLAIFGLQKYNQSVSKPDAVAQKESFTPPNMTATNPENQVLEEEKESEKSTHDLLIKKQESEKDTKEKQRKNKSKLAQNTSPNVDNLPRTKDSSNGIADENGEKNFKEKADFNKEIIHSEESKDEVKDEVLAESKMQPEMAKSASPSSPLAATNTPSPLDEEEFDKAYAPVILSNDSVNLAEADDAMPAESSTLIGRVVKGKVLSEGGEPLIGANVIITGTPAGTVTDFEGDFTLQLPSNNSTIDIQYIGYEDVRVNLQNQNDIRINMESSANLEEVAVTAFGNKAKKSAKRSKKTFEAKEETNLDAAPEIGFSAFEKYLKENIRLSKSDNENTTSETVIVQFKVKKSGVLSDFKILQSGGVTCDAEAIRLLKEGPKWKAMIDTVTSYSIKCGK